MDYRKTAQEIYDHIGKKENIISAAHCATRLRLVISDNLKADKEYVENIEGVKGVFFAHVDADCRKARGDLALDGLHKGVRLGLMGVEIAHDLVIALGIEVFEAGILQLPFDLLHAEPVGQRRIDVHGLAGLGDLLFRALELHGAGEYS